ncbi:uncharacterized protein YydD (DUF2326 family) [Marinilabilia salmonicolor]|jgi:uncharacterized protein YydD (DUF2326 family)|uniref:DUF2326 domain-containing protein n=1 Tax=Marinilabilia salmonicolor TaxID=989 RepID=UPI000D0809D3|nr:DUF2326 domain-containing protein [Marinilabilia salmonicolor]PRY90339.1 uncharacterized protein YydD (DUF2326 family) [Marinilabilia salmonicolor]
MFLKKLIIENSGVVIRDISFQKGINLIIDETRTEDRKESGNNVGKTTVLRLIDYCLGSKGKNIYEDAEFKDRANNHEVEEFLKKNNVVVTLILKEDPEVLMSKEITIRRNFLPRGEKIQEINGEPIGDLKEFNRELTRQIFKTTIERPTFRQIIAKNIRDEKYRLENVLKVLHSTTKREEYEALYLFWLGIPIDNHARKQELLTKISIEKNLQKRLRKENNYARTEQALIVVERDIHNLETQKESFNLNEEYENYLEELNQSKGEINRLSTLLGQLELRREMIIESKEELEKEVADINVNQIRSLYEEASALIPNIQKSFEDTLKFHNEMITEKLKYILAELPDVETEIKKGRNRLRDLRQKEREFTNILQKKGALDELQAIIGKLNALYENKGHLEEQQKMWESSNRKLETLQRELEQINEGINAREALIKDRITHFNKYFSEISGKLYGEQFLLVANENERGYGLSVETVSGNPGTGKKKGQIAAFDLAYILFADDLELEQLHFILHDQIENVHDNQISGLLTEIVERVNCQYVLPVLREKLPEDIPVEDYTILTLSQSDKLFRI